MRDVFFRKLEDLAEIDKDIVLITNDVGYSFFDSFVEKHPSQFVNAGIMEQTIMGIAAGLALAGKKPYVYSMIPFVTMRCYEQLRNDVCYENLNVKVIGVKGSEHYRFLGPSHNIVDGEDVKILAHLPNLSIHLPRTADETQYAVQVTYDLHKPAYIRL